MIVLEGILDIQTTSMVLEQWLFKGKTYGDKFYVMHLKLNDGVTCGQHQLKKDP